jgi:hypothetical protein
MEKKTDDQKKKNDKVEDLQHYELMEQPSMVQRDTNLLSNEILFNSMEMLSLVLELDLFNILGISNDYYRQIVEIAVSLFHYDKKNLPFLSVL